LFREASINGLHIIAEFHNCQAGDDLMRGVAALEHVCVLACSQAGLSVVGKIFHGFGTADSPAGATGAVVLAESHIAVHTWPELDAVTLDIYVCNFSQDNRAAAEATFAALHAAFVPGSVVRRDVVRGRLFE
jgi:spermidine synthase/S-adenosylmethionine decarboxylase